MKSIIKNQWIFCLVSILLISVPLHSQVKVVTTFSDFALIAEEIGGNNVEADYLSHGDQDPHFVPPKPSLALKLQDADLLISTGLDLEMWLTTLQDKARNKQIMDGAIGFITASPGIQILEKPEMGSLSRSEGDVHVLGNPHIQTSPINWKKISQNILIGLKRVDPESALFYEKNQKDFVRRVDNAMFGEALVELFGGDQLEELLLAGTLFDFLENSYLDGKLIDLLDGWLKEALPFRGKEIIAYHKNWSYFARDFGLHVLGYIEPKPGIPPTPRHVEQTIQLIQDRDIDLMLVASYFEKRKPNTIAQKTGIRPLFLPVSVGAIPEAMDPFSLMNYWIHQIKQALSETAE